MESPARASKGNPVYAKQLVIALAGAKALGSDAHAYGVELALACRKDTLQRDTLWQRKWGIAEGMTMLLASRTAWSVSA